MLKTLIRISNVTKLVNTLILKIIKRRIRYDKRICTESKINILWWPIFHLMMINQLTLTKWCVFLNNCCIFNLKTCFLKALLIRSWGKIRWSNYCRCSCEEQRLSSPLQKWSKVCSYWKAKVLIHMLIYQSNVTFKFKILVTTELNYIL